MILVTVGTEKFPFNRLMHWLEQLLQAGLIREEVVVQYGTCTYVPSGTKVYRLLNERDFRSLIREARVVVAHCGEGTVLLLDDLSAPYILTPRSKRYGEHVDDHQIELAQALADLGVPIAWGPADLARFLLQPIHASIQDLSVDAARSLSQKLLERYGHSHANGS